MKKAPLYIILFILLIFSCRVSQVNHETISGTFYFFEKKKHFSKSYTLELKTDSTFKFVISQTEANPQCEGRWRLEGDMIIVECEEAQVYEMITNGYLSTRKHTFRVVKNDKLEYQGMMLRRKPK